MPEECEQLQNALFDFQLCVKVNIGSLKGEPITLDLLPGSKPSYGNLFSLPKAYQQIMKDEIA
jgi:hypothetical protein